MAHWQKEVIDTGEESSMTLLFRENYIRLYEEKMKWQPIVIISVQPVEVKDILVFIKLR